MGDTAFLTQLWKFQDLSSQLFIFSEVPTWPAHLDHCGKRQGRYGAGRLQLPLAVVHDLRHPADPDCGADGNTIQCWLVC